MDILPTNIVPMITTSFKAIILIGACAIVAVNYFHTKEARKMERKLSINLPGSVSLAMSLQMLLSVAFLFVATTLLFFF